MKMNERVQDMEHGIWDRIYYITDIFFIFNLGTDIYNGKKC